MSKYPEHAGQRLKSYGRNHRTRTLATGDKIHVSGDGVSWAARALPKGTSIDMVARDDSGTFVGLSVDGRNFYYSDDGLRWNKAAAPEGNTILAVRAGAGLPSALCKLP